MISKSDLSSEMMYSIGMTKDYIHNLAKAGLGVAKDIAEVRPDVILIPLNGGFVPYKIALEALRKNIKISTSEYDPLVIFVPAGYEKHGKDYRIEMTNKFFEKFLKKRQKYEKRSGFDKLMILDTVNTGTSLERIISLTLNTLKKVAKEIYVSCISTPEFFMKKLRELNLVEQYQKPGSIENFSFHDSVAVRRYDDKPIIIGYEKYGHNDRRVKEDEFEEKNGKMVMVSIRSKKEVDFFPNLDSQNIEHEPGISKEFYLKLSSALDNL